MRGRGGRGTFVRDEKIIVVNRRYEYHQYGC